MNYAHPTIDHDEIKYQASQLPQALDFARTNCQICNVTVERLTNDHCTGAEHWRDAHTDHRKPKLYIIHPLNVACPIHGNPEPGKRIRTYIGTDPAKIAAAQEALTRHRHYKNAFRELQELHRCIHRAHVSIKEAWFALGLNPPNPDDLQPLGAPIEG